MGEEEDHDILIRIDTKMEYMSHYIEKREKEVDGHIDALYNKTNRNKTILWGLIGTLSGSGVLVGGLELFI